MQWGTKKLWPLDGRTSDEFIASHGAFAAYVAKQAVHVKTMGDCERNGAVWMRGLRHIVVLFGLSDRYAPDFGCKLSTNVLAI